MKEFDLLIFDLDGTIIDSRHDLVTSINLMLAEYNADVLKEELVVRFIGRGVRNLVKQSVEASTAPRINIDDALKRFNLIYSEHALDTTILYPAVIETLEEYSEQKKVILSNKSENFIHQILRGLHIEKYFSYVIGGDTLPFMKPSREPIDFILHRYNIDANRSMIIGDSATDINAGKAARIKTCGVLYGLTPVDEVLNLGADYTIQRFSELIEIVN